MNFRRKDGKLAVEYLAIIVLVLAVLVIMLVFSDKIRLGITEGLSNFFGDIIRRR